MVHRALFGSIERFFGVMVEHFDGAFPTWLAPVQAVVIPVADSSTTTPARSRLRAAGRDLRVEVDHADDTLGAKIRRAQPRRCPTR